MKIVLFSIFIALTYTSNASSNLLKNGKWNVQLELDSSNNLPFEVIIKSDRITIINSDEQIELNNPVKKNDSIYYKFPFFDSELVIKNNNSKEFDGYWYNYSKSSSYKIRVHGKKSKSNRFNIKKNNPLNFNGKWQVTFNEDSRYNFPAIGLFEQNTESHYLTGTFLTETGDFRFLSGNIKNDSLFLSCFDGSHAFLFKAKLQNDTIYGKFYSGNHYNTTWKGYRNDDYELSNPNKLTYLKDNESLSFTCSDMNNMDYNYPNDSLNGKVVIIQIMGTWCPNCLDETIFYKELYTKYHNQGLEIISVCYETGEDFTTRSSSVKKLQTKLETEFIYLVGGQASKKTASKQFSALNNITSFPTSIIIDKNGNVNTIHTGFSGPATGMIYTIYKEKMNNLIKDLLAN